MRVKEEPEAKRSRRSEEPGKVKDAGSRSGTPKDMNKSSTTTKHAANSEHHRGDSEPHRRSTDAVGGSAGDRGQSTRLSGATRILNYLNHTSFYHTGFLTNFKCPYMS